MSKLIGGSPNPQRQVLTVQQILGEPNGANQHMWYDIPRIPVVAAKITASYIAHDPAHTVTYQHNLVAFDNALQPLLREIKQIKVQYGGVPVAYTEPVPGYLLVDAGLSIKTPAGFAKSIEDGVDPSPSDNQEMDSLMTNKAVKALLYNSQATSPVTEQVKNLAIQAKIPVIGVSETMPANALSYQSWQLIQLKQLESALKGTR